MIVPQLLYLPDVHFNPADGAGDRFILSIQQRCLIWSKSK